MSKYIIAKKNGKSHFTKKEDFPDQKGQDKLYFFRYNPQNSANSLNSFDFNGAFWKARNISRHSICNGRFPFPHQPGQRYEEALAL